MNEFQYSFDSYVKDNNIEEANRVLMEELGLILIKDKINFINLLNESNIKANIEMSDAKLINLFIDNIGRNKKLMVGSALLVNHHNKMMGFDGDNEVNDKSVKDSYAVMYSYFDDVYDVDEGYAEDDSEFIGGLAKGASALLNKGGGNSETSNTLAKGGVDIANKIIDNRRRSKAGAIDELYRQKEAKRQMINAVMEQRRRQQQIQEEALKQKQKNTKIGLIIGGSVLGLAVMGGFIYLLKK